MTDSNFDQLREAALARGYRVIRSRVRKEGTKDFGKVGLTSASGKKILGFGKQGLTATPQDVEEFLRIENASSWETSAKRAKIEKPKRQPARAPDVEEDDSRSESEVIEGPVAPREPLPLLVRDAHAKDSKALLKLLSGAIPTLTRPKLAKLLAADQPAQVRLIIAGQGEIVGAAA